MTEALQNCDWIADACRRLVGLLVPGCGWGYTRGSIPATEPTALACLALRANGAGKQEAAGIGARWLASIQQANGAIGISQTVPVPEWPTAYAILAWAGSPAHVQQAQSASKWLLSRTGSTFRDDARILGHDPTIVGWPWNAGTHSWIEPTAIAVLALRRQGLGEHVRAREGLRLIKDRAISTGGWNYGNNAIYGTVLRPQPGPTGMALAALSGVHGDDAMITRGCAYLEDAAVKLRAPQSLCWALIGLSTWNRKPPGSGEWLRQTYERVLHRGETAPQLSYLLLAAGSDSLRLLGLGSPASGRSV